MKLSLEQFLIQHHTPESVKSYLYNIQHFLALNPKANRYRYKDIVVFMDTQSQYYKNEVTRGTQLSAIKKYYDYLIATGQRNEHPCKSLYVKRPKHQIQLQQLFTPEELQLLFNRENRFKDLELRNKVIISILIYQGLRTEEVCNLQVSHIDLDVGSLYVRATRTTSSRTLELHRNQILLFDKYIHTIRPNICTKSMKTLLMTQRGVPMNVESIGRMLRPLRGLFPDRQLNPNTIRQSVIANWLNVKKYPLGDVQLMAGHKYPSSTERYLAKNSDSQRKLINQFHPLG